MSKLNKEQQDNNSYSTVATSTESEGTLILNIDQNGKDQHRVHK